MTTFAISPLQQFNFAFNNSLSSFPIENKTEIPKTNSCLSILRKISKETPGYKLPTTIWQMISNFAVPNNYLNYVKETNGGILATFKFDLKTELFKKRPKIINEIIRYANKNIDKLHIHAKAIAPPLLNNITELDLSNISYDDPCLIALSSYVPNVKRLVVSRELSGNSQLSHFTKLEELVIKRIKENDFDQFQRLLFTQLLSIKKLELSGYINIFIDILLENGLLSSRNSLFTSLKISSYVLNNQNNKLTTLKNLTVLEIAKCSLEGTHVISTLSHLTTLSLTGRSNSQDPLFQLEALGQLTNLTTLHLPHILIDINALKLFPQLTSLKLRLETITPATVEILISLKNLTQLELYCHSLSDIQLAATIPNLTQLYLYPSSVSLETEWQTLVVLQTNRDLPIALNINYKLTSMEWGYISQLTQLTEIHITGAIIDTEFQFMQKLPHLKNVNFIRCTLTGNGWKGLACLKTITALQLHRCRLTDLNLRYIAPLTQLKQLILKNHPTNLTSKGLAHLVTLTQLQYLDIEEVAFSNRQLTTIHNLQKQLPSLHISEYQIFHEKTVLEWFLHHLKAISVIVSDLFSEIREVALLGFLVLSIELLIAIIASILISE